MCQSKQETCNAKSPFRTADGSCNNLKNPSWGKAGSCMPRLLHSDYANGVNTSRAARSGRPLPNVRVVSNTMHPELILPDPERTSLTTHFGQFLTHDIAYAIMVTDLNGVNDLGDPFDIPPGNNQLCCFLFL